MKLHENKALFRQAVQFTADQMNIPALYVEMDYWVTYALSTIFHNEIGKGTVFKGGISFIQKPETNTSTPAVKTTANALNKSSWHV